MGLETLKWAKDSKVSYRIQRWIAEDDLAELRHFYASEFRPNYPLLNRSLLDWYFGPKHFSGGIGQIGSWSIVTAWHAKSIIGHLGTIPVPVRIGGQVLQGVWHTNLYVSPDFAGQGIGSKLIAEGLTGYDVMLGFDYTEQAHKLYRVRGYSLPGELTRYLRILSWQRASSLLDPSCSSDSWIQCSLRSTALKVVDATACKACHQVHEGPFQLEDSYPQLWERFSSRFAGTVDRTSELMRWRYQENPSFEYRSFRALASDGSLAGLAVYRIDRVSTGDDVSILRVLDLISNDESVEPLLHAIEDHARAQAVTVIEFYCNSRIFEEHFDACGYVSSPHPLTYSICRLYHPPRWTDPRTIRFCFKFSDRGTAYHADSLETMSNWYGALSDSDLDRVQR